MNVASGPAGRLSHNGWHRRSLLEQMFALPLKNRGNRRLRSRWDFIRRDNLVAPVSIIRLPAPPARFAADPWIRLSTNSPCAAAPMVCPAWRPKMPRHFRESRNERRWWSCSSRYRESLRHRAAQSPGMPNQRPLHPAERPHNRLTDTSESARSRRKKWGKTLREALGQRVCSESNKQLNVPCSIQDKPRRALDVCLTSECPSYSIPERIRNGSL